MILEKYRKGERTNRLINRTVAGVIFFVGVLVVTFGIISSINASTTYRVVFFILLGLLFAIIILHMLYISNSKRFKEQRKLFSEIREVFLNQLAFDKYKGSFREKTELSDEVKGILYSMNNDYIVDLEGLHIIEGDIGGCHFSTFSIDSDLVTQGQILILNAPMLVSRKVVVSPREHLLKGDRDESSLQYFNRYYEKTNDEIISDALIETIVKYTKKHKLDLYLIINPYQLLVFFETFESSLKLGIAYEKQNIVNKDAYRWLDEIVLDFLPGEKMIIESDVEAKVLTDYAAKLIGEKIDKNYVYYYQNQIKGLMIFDFDCAKIITSEKEVARALVSKAKLEYEKLSLMVSGAESNVLPLYLEEGFEIDQIITENEKSYLLIWEKHNPK